MSEIKFRYERSGKPASPPEVILPLNEYKELQAESDRRLALLRRVLDEIFPSQDDWGEIFDDGLISDLNTECHG